MTNSHEHRLPGMCGLIRCLSIFAVAGVLSLAFFTQSAPAEDDPALVEQDVRRIQARRLKEALLAAMERAEKERVATEADQQTQLLEEGDAEAEAVQNDDDSFPHGDYAGVMRVATIDEARILDRGIEPGMTDVLRDVASTKNRNLLDSLRGSDLMADSRLSLFFQKHPLEGPAREDDPYQEGSIAIITEQPGGKLLPSEFAQYRDPTKTSAMMTFTAKGFSAHLTAPEDAPEPSLVGPGGVYRISGRIDGRRLIGDIAIEWQGAPIIQATFELERLGE